jgi:hypothetical protein
VRNRRGGLVTQGIEQASGTTPKIFIELVRDGWRVFR